MNINKNHSNKQPSKMSKMVERDWSCIGYFLSALTPAEKKNCKTRTSPLKDFEKETIHHL